jgi:hypothetical protein
MPFLLAALLHGAFAHGVPVLGRGLSVTTPNPEGQQGLPGAEPQSLGTLIHLRQHTHSQQQQHTKANSLCTACGALP